MTFAARWRRVLAAALSATSVVAIGCSSTDATCDCADPAITISIPADIASSVSSVSVSGAACTGVKATPTNLTNGGTAYAFTANAAGSCLITVSYAGGTFADSVTITQVKGCCAGFYASPISAAQVDVPEPAGDAG